MRGRVSLAVAFVLTLAGVFGVSAPARADTTVYASDTAYIQIANGWGPVERDRSNGGQAAGDGNPIRIAGVQYAKGLGVHANSTVRVPVPAGATTFRAVAGIDDEVGGSGIGWASVYMRVYDPSGGTMYDSGPLYNGDPRTVSLTVTGLSYLTLDVWDHGDGNSGDHADWADARFTIPGGDPLISVGKTATASSQESTSYTPVKAVDGSVSTSWSSQFSDPQWIRIDLGATANVSRVVLRWETAYGRSYRIETSPDGSTWTPIFSTTTGDGGVDDLAVTGSGRYIRMYGTARGTQWGYSLWELEVYGTFPSPPPGGGPPPAGGYFPTLPSRAPLPDEATCAGQVHRSSWEPRTQNTEENTTVPPAGANQNIPRGNWGGVPEGEALKDRITGDFAGTTDEIIQWAACKWGFNDDTVRAQAVIESWWHMDTGRDQGFGDFTTDSSACQPRYPIGSFGGTDCPTSFGILQIKDEGGTAGPHEGTFPWSIDSTAWNLDYTLAMRRACYEGWLWIGPQTRDQLRDCIGLWFSGSWQQGDADYKNSYDNALSTKPWLSW